MSLAVDVLRQMYVASTPHCSSAVPPPQSPPLPLPVPLASVLAGLLNALTDIHVLEIIQKLGA